MKHVLEQYGKTALICMATMGVFTIVFMGVLSSDGGFFSGIGSMFQKTQTGISMSENNTIKNFYAKNKVEVYSNTDKEVMSDVIYSPKELVVIEGNEKEVFLRVLSVENQLGHDVSKEVLQDEMLQFKCAGQYQIRMLMSQEDGTTEIYHVFINVNDQGGKV